MTTGSGPWGPQVSRVPADLDSVEDGMDRSRASAALAAAEVSDWSDHLAADRDQWVHIGGLSADLDSLADLVALVAPVAERPDLGPVFWIIPCSRGRASSRGADVARTAKPGLTLARRLARDRPAAAR